MDLHGRVAIVTGGGVRLGKALVLALANAGCHVGIHYGHSAQEAAEVAEAARNTGVQATTIQADLASPENAARTIVSQVTNELGHVSILVNSAAIFEPGTLQTTDADNWHRHFAINLEAPFCLCREFARQRGDAPASSPQPGHIVNIVDWRALRPIEGHLAYTLAKSGLVTLTKLLARELAPQVQVNAIAPGAILPAPGMSSAEFQQQAERIPLQRTGRPDDVAGTLLFLLRSEFLTGEIIHVTGGEQL